eukprot:gene6367-9751_t
MDPDGGSEEHFDPAGDEVYYARMAELLKQGGQGSPPRKRTPKNSRSTDEVLDFIEYYNSGRMAKHTVERLYRPKPVENEEAKHFLTRGARERVHQREAREKRRLLRRIDQCKERDVSIERLANARPPDEENLARLCRSDQRKQMIEHYKAVLPIEEVGPDNYYKYKSLLHNAALKTSLPPDTQAPGTGPWKKEVWKPIGLANAFDIDQVRKKREKARLKTSPQKIAIAHSSYACNTKTTAQYKKDGLARRKLLDAAKKETTWK